MTMRPDDATAVREAEVWLRGQRAVARIWAHDPTLWKPDPADDRELSDRLGWLDLPAEMLAALPELEAFAAAVQQSGIQDVAVLGMGGSSLCPEVFRRTFLPAPGFPRLHVLDATVPETVLALRRALDPARTLFVVSSKSGTTTEAVSFYRYFAAEVEAVRGEQAGENFAAITDAGAPLAALGRERGFRRVFLNRPDIVGRYSALSYFGLVPAALLGMPLRPLLERAQRMAAACRNDDPDQNPGLRLGAALGALARRGRDKVTILPAPEIGSFGLWAEQLLAESTGKEGKGLIPIGDEPPGDLSVYGDDRVFVAIGRQPPKSEALLAALAWAGHPVLRLELDGALDLGAEFFQWEFATAVAGALLAINPFDQPNVQESKDITDRTLRQAQATGSLPALATDGPLAAVLDTARPGDYVAIMAFLPETGATDALLARLRAAITARTRLATTLGYGPRFLHSTGQLHKGGPDSFIGIQLTADSSEDAAVPGAPYTFGTLAAAQAIGDFEALRAHGRRVVRIHLGRDSEGGIRRLIEDLGPGN